MLFNIASIKRTVHNANTLAKAYAPFNANTFKVTFMKAIGKFLNKPTRHIVAVLCSILGLLLPPVPMLAQNPTTVHGVIKDSKGQPVVGAYVVEDGTTNGTVTDLDGKFTIKVTSNQLKVSYIGYNTEAFSPRPDGKAVEVILKEDNVELGDIVVVGYGAMKRSDVTGSVVSVGDEAIKKSVITSVDQVLQGRAAGVSIQANSGQPGASTSIRIRGINSLNASNQPIFVIDGVVVDAATSDENSNPLSSINPSDIVSMDVLKDASATAIYGSRASNGVIMITTKKGKSGESTITYDGYAGWQEMPTKIDMLNQRQYAQLHNERADLNIVEKSSTFVRPDLLPDGTDWQEELFTRAAMQSHNLSVTGGSEKTTYAISGGYLDQKGIALGSSFQRVSFRGSVDSEIKKFLRGGVNFSFSESRQEIGTDNNVIMSALMQQPTVAVTGPDGSFDGPDDVWMPDNPVGLASLKTNNNKKVNFRFSAYLEADIVNDFKFKSEVSADYNFNRYYYYEPDYTFGIKTQDTRTSNWTKDNSRYVSWRNTLNYNKVFADLHNVNIMLGQEMSRSDYENQYGSTTGFLTNSTPDLSAGDRSKSAATGYKNHNSIASGFGRIFYSFDDRYLLTFTLRRDGSSKFSEDNRWGWFPAAAIAWKASNEAFLKDNEVLTTAKLRLGWGQTGNQNVSDWAYMSMLAFKNTKWGNGVLTGNTANPDLEWETTESYNVGVDLSFLSNRIELIADGYYKKTKNLLLQLPLPAFLGSAGYGAASNPWGNVGSLENKGFELTLNTVNIDKGDFSWRTNVVFSLNRNKVKELDSASSSIEKVFQIGSSKYTVTKTVVGEPIGQFWGYKVIGRFDKPEDFYYKDANGNIQQVALPEGNSISQSGTTIGDYRFADLNNDGVINNEDCTFLGNPEPKFTYGFGNTFSWKGVDLTIFFSGAYGGKAFNFTRTRIDDPRVNSNVTVDALNHAVVEKIDPDGSDDWRNLHVVGGASDMVAIQTSDANQNFRPSDRFVEDASYIRLQNISLSWTLPSDWVSKIKLSNVRIYGNIQNVYTWTEYKGMDPEIGAMYGDALMTGFDYGRYPSPRIFTFGLTVSY